MSRGRWHGTGGYTITVDPEGPTVERDTTQCVHCMRHWTVVPGSGRRRGFCMQCGGPHCGSPACWACVPFMRRIEEEDRRARLREALTRLG